MKKVLIIRYCAYGDAIHMSHLPRLLKKSGFDIVDVETNPKGLQILAENPYIDNLTCFDNTAEPFKGMTYSWLERRWQAISEGYDKVINLYKSLEYGYIAMEDQAIYYQNSKTRREKFGNKNYYDISSEWAGLSERGVTGEMYFKTSEIKAAEDYISKYKDQFKVLVNLSGSSLHKYFVQAKEVSRRIVERYPDALIITTGDKQCEGYDFSMPNKVSMVNKNSFRGLALLSKYMNLVIGCESGLMVAADMWHTPTIQLLTAANNINHGVYSKNNYSIQSPIVCSPCHKGPYKYIGCPTDDNGYPKCIHFNIDHIMFNVERAYNECFASPVA